MPSAGLGQQDTKGKQMFGSVSQGYDRIGSWPSPLQESATDQYKLVLETSIATIFWWYNYSSRGIGGPGMPVISALTRPLGKDAQVVFEPWTEPFCIVWTDIPIFIL